VKYETDTGWSSGYSVVGTVIGGSDLNAATSTFNYEPLATYVVIFWSEGQASILKLSFYAGSISEFGQRATDQYGRAWRVAQTTLCY